VSTPPQNTSEGQATRETDRPRHRDTPATGNSKTDAPYPPPMTHQRRAAGRCRQSLEVRL
jgi:hypothetical protein